MSGVHLNNPQVKSTLDMQAAAKFQAIQRVRNDLTEIEDAARGARNLLPDGEIKMLFHLVSRLAQIVRQDIAP